MKTDLVSILNRESQRLISCLDEHPSGRRLFEGTISAAEYASFLEQTYHYVRWTRPLLAHAGERLAKLGRGDALSEVFLRKAREETGHERWALSDLQILGRDERSVARGAPSAAVRAYIAWNRFTVEAGPPVAFLGTAYVLEALSARRAGEVVKNLLSRSAIPRVHEAVTFLRGHGDVDGDHLERLSAMLTGISDGQDREAIALSAQMTRLLYPGVFEGSAPSNPTRRAGRVMISGARAP